MIDEGEPLPGNIGENTIVIIDDIPKKLNTIKDD